MIKKWLSLIKFALVGVVNTLIDFIIYALLTKFNLNYLAAQCISYSAGVLNSYMMNRKWTFELKGKGSKREFFTFIGVNLLTLVITTFLLTMFYKWLGISLIISKLLVTGISVGINYMGAKTFVFTKLKERRTTL
ncbi:sugar translocase [Bacillus sp. AFS076308]|uniref:GtrA family protein n=1 Tax=unclassified Bacillus (in: firmicutes) TaxID=185979 RepID=UPI000BF25DA2|nr:MULTISPECIES: GtrA family protein [unclassified Bacillus (in: firmicutes)]PFO09320.1 sugar translocase [Bacillus sp. AFS076308]PGV50298.1 sugar translocase [Bacillus sp. AFS037270]